MDIEIVSERKNPYLSRIEMHFIVKYPGGPTPKRELVQGALADMIGVKREFVVVDSLKTQFGSESAKGYAKIYRARRAASGSRGSRSSSGTSSRRRRSRRRTRSPLRQSRLRRRRRRSPLRQSRPR